MNGQLWGHDQVTGWGYKFELTEQQRELLDRPFRKIIDTRIEAEYREREEQLRVLGAVPITNPM